MARQDRWYDGVLCLGRIIGVIVGSSVWVYLLLRVITTIVLLVWQPILNLLVGWLIIGVVGVAIFTDDAKTPVTWAQRVVMMPPALIAILVALICGRNLDDDT